MSTNLISIEEISKHNAPSDCWIVINDQVWDMTDFAPSHPGGPDIIHRHAGRDASHAYSEVHAPSIVQENLPAANLKGKIDATTMTPKWLEPPPPTPQSQPSSSPAPPQQPPLSSILSAHDFELAARQTSSAKTWAFYSSAATDLVTRDANISLFSRIWFRPRVMRDVSTVSTETTILGCRSSLPLFISPASMAKLIHPDGELAIARAAHAQGIIQCISTSASYTAAEIIASVPTSAPPHPFFFQLYVDRQRSRTTSLLRTLFSPTQQQQQHQDQDDPTPNPTPHPIRALLLTADASHPGKRELDERTPTTPTSHQQIDALGSGYGRTLSHFISPSLTWPTTIPYLRRLLPPSTPLVLKGVTSASDVLLALTHHLDGVLLSNHGGRNLDTSPPALLTLLECHKRCPHVFGRSDFEILIDGGIRRGTDVLKCLALGARAVGVGRPVLWANAYGQAGVERLIGILRDELEGAMRNVGVRKLDEVGPELVNTGDVDHLVPGEEGHPYVRDWRGGGKARL